MSKSNKSDYRPMADQLREMTLEAMAAGTTLNSIAVEIGVPQPVLYRFVHGEREGIRMETADKLCEFFGVRLTAPKRRPGKG